MNEGRAEWARAAGEIRQRTLEELLDAHQSMVLRLALRMTGNKEDAQDAAQEAFLKVHRSIHLLDADRDARPWICRITVNACLDLMRARRRTEPVCETPAHNDTERELIAAERVRAVEIALCHLPEKERAALVLREVEGFSTAQVAEILESSEATVRSQIRQARMKLRAMVGE